MPSVQSLHILLCLLALRQTAMDAADIVCIGSQDVLVDGYTNELGSLVSHAGVGTVKYANYMNCSWKLISPIGFLIETFFVYMDLELRYDWVYLADSYDMQIANVSLNAGNYNTTVYVSGDRLQNVMTVWFHTDLGIGGFGFRLLYRARPIGRLTAAFQLRSVPDQTATVTVTASARSDIECAALCSTRRADCGACEFRFDSGACVMYDRKTSGLVKMP